MIIFVVSNMAQLVVFDTETNGLEWKVCDLLSVGWIKIKLIEEEPYFDIIEHIEYLIKNPNIHNNELCLGINKITDEMREENGEPLEKVLAAFKNAIKNSYVFAYNAEFDVSFMQKYDKNIFSECEFVGDIMKCRGESVICCIQRIIWECFHSFDKFVCLNQHLHSAYDDVLVELIILLHDYLGYDVRWMFEDVESYEPEITTGKFRHMRISEVMRNEPNYMKWFLFNKESPWENYLREYILSKYNVNTDDISGELNSFTKSIIEAEEKQQQRCHI